MNKLWQWLEFILPIGYWENEFITDWKNGKYPNIHFLNFLSFYKKKIGPKILDIGSGDGRHLILMAILGYQLVGLELTKSGIKKCGEKLLQYKLPASLAEGDFHHLPFGDCSFDTTVSTQALHYNNWPGVKQSFAEISRVLKPGGFFFFRARSSKGAWRNTDRQISDERGITRIETRGKEKFIVMVHDYTIDEIIDLAQENGLEIIGDPIDEDIDGREGQWNVVFRKF